MKSNMCNVDRIVRAVIGIAMIGATLFGVIGLWGWLGIVLLATSAVSYCPIYKVLEVLGFNSCGVFAGGCSRADASSTHQNAPDMKKGAAQ